MSRSLDEATRLAYLEAMGVEVWLRREGSRGESTEIKAGSEEVGPGSKESGVATGPAADVTEETLRDTRSVSAGLARSGAGATPLAADPEASAHPASAAAGGSSPVAATLDELASLVAACRQCSLHETRTQTVFGVGNPNADLMIIGEAPGAEEDRQGEPFVGRAGRLLNAMLQAIGLQRRDVYIANILKCRPPGNRNPSLEEAAACQGHLERQIELVAPKLILSVGAVSARNLLGTEEAVGRLRRSIHRHGPAEIPVLVTYHPAYLLRRPEEKAKAWEDLQEAARRLA